MDESIQTVGVVIFKDDSVLLVRHLEGADSPIGIYGIPSGRVEENETERAAAVHELFEETGLKAEEKDLIQIPKIYTANVERKTGEKKFMTMTAFRLNIFSGELLPSEETAPEWVNVAKIQELKLRPNIEQVIKDARLV